MTSQTPRLERPDGGGAVRLEAPGAGQPLEGDTRLVTLESLYALKDMAWAVYLQDGGWRLHVAAGLAVMLNGIPTGGSALRTGDVLEFDGVWRFVLGEWPGPADAAFDARVLAAPDDDALALVYRDVLLERGSARAETLRRPVPRSEQARHLWPLAREVARGHVEGRFAGPSLRKVIARDPGLDLVGFTAALARLAPLAPRLSAVQTLGLSMDDTAQLALLLAREPALGSLQHLEAGSRGAFRLDDFRAGDARQASALALMPPSGPREGPARPLALEVVSWDGWTVVEPLTSRRRMTLLEDTSLVLHDGGAALVPGADGPVRWRRADDWVLEVTAVAPDAVTPRLAGLVLRGAFGVLAGDLLEVVPGLVCRLGPG